MEFQGGESMGEKTHFVTPKGRGVSFTGHPLNSSLFHNRQYQYWGKAGVADWALSTFVIEFWFVFAQLSS